MIEERNTEIPNQESVLSDIKLLGDEVYGKEFDKFLETPRKSLHGRSPKEAIAQGDAGNVLSGLAATSEGSDHV